jgi:hypothetical protein
VSEIPPQKPFALKEGRNSKPTSHAVRASSTTTFDTLLRRAFHLRSVRLRATEDGTEGRPSKNLRFARASYLFLDSARRLRLPLQAECQPSWPHCEQISFFHGALGNGLSGFAEFGAGPSTVAIFWTSESKGSVVTTATRSAKVGEYFRISSRVTSCQIGRMTLWTFACSRDVRPSNS